MKILNRLETQSKSMTASSRYHLQTIWKVINYLNVEGSLRCFTERTRSTKSLLNSAKRTICIRMQWKLLQSQTIPILLKTY